MKIASLIERLKELPPEADITVAGDEEMGFNNEFEIEENYMDDAENNLVGYLIVPIESEPNY